MDRKKPTVKKVARAFVKRLEKVDFQLNGLLPCITSRMAIPSPFLNNKPLNFNSPHKEPILAYRCMLVSWSQRSRMLMQNDTILQ